MSTYDYDLFVIGGGSGGVRSARVAASLGKKVAIAEEYRFGGTCVIRGCVPKKLFVYASQFLEHFEDAAGFGWTVGESSFDWKALVAAKDKEIARLEGLYRKGLENAKADNRKLKLLFLGVGTEDTRYPGLVKVDKLLTQAGIHHEMHTTPGEHEWKVWRHLLVVAMPKLFQPAK